MTMGKEFAMVRKVKINVSMLKLSGFKFQHQFFKIQMITDFLCFHDDPKAGSGS